MIAIKQDISLYGSQHTLYAFAAVLTTLEFFLGQCSKGSGVSQTLYLFTSALNMPFLMFLNGVFCRDFIKNKEKTFDRIIYLIYLFFLVKVITWIIEFCLAGKVSFALFSDDNLIWYFPATVLFLFLAYTFKGNGRKYLFIISLIVGLGSGFITWLEMFPVVLKALVFAPFFYFGYICDIDKTLKQTRGVWPRIWFSFLIILALFGILRFSRNLNEMRDFIEIDVYEKAHFGIDCVMRFIIYGVSFFLSIAILIIASLPKGKCVYNAEKRFNTFYFWQCLLSYLIVHFNIYDKIELLFGHKLGRILWIVCGMILAVIISSVFFQYVLSALIKGLNTIKSLWLLEYWNQRDLLFIYTFSFITVFLIAWSPFLQTGRTFIWSDGVTQHFPLVVNFRNAVCEGLANILQGKFEFPFFELYAGLGDDTIGLLGSSGATDPLNLLLILFPIEYAEYLYAFLAIFRLYLAGLSFQFLCGYFKKRRQYILIGSLIYCFCGYAVFCAMRHPYFVNPMIILPLLLVGIDKILKGQKPYLFTFAVFYAALCGFYHLYMMTIMLGMYWIARSFDLGIIKSPRIFFRAIWKAGYGYVLGIGLSAVIFFPAVSEYLSSWRSGSSNYPGQYAWSNYRAFLLHFISPSGSWDFMAFAAIVLLALIFMFCTSIKNRRLLKTLTIIAFALYMNRIGGLILNGFQYPSNRWTFCLALVMSYIVVEMLPELVNMTMSQRWIGLGALCLYAWAFFSTGNSRKSNYALLGVFWLAMTLCVLGFNSEADLKETKWKNYRTAFCYALIMANVGINGLYLFAPDQGNYISEFRRQLGEEIQRINNSVEQQAKSYLDGTIDGRLDSSQIVVNTSYMVQVPTMLIYSSTANENVLRFWSEIEHSSSAAPFNMSSTEMRTIAGTLLSEKYQIEPLNRIQYIPYGYSEMGITDKNNLIFQNQYALPWGYTYEKVISYDDLVGLNGIKKQEAMLQAIALDNEIASDDYEHIAFNDKQLPYTMTCDNCKWENGILNVFKENAMITLDFSMSGNTEGYIRLQGFDINDSGKSNFSFKVASGDIVRTSSARSTLDSWYFGRTNYLLNLGFSKNERSTFKITFPVKGAFKLKNIEIYALPMDNYPKQVEALREEPLENIKITTNHISGTVNLSKDKYLCMSIPYSKGWKATVDGEEKEILRGNYMFMVLPLSEGYHEIEFSYCSPGLKTGVLISGISICIIAGLVFFDRYKTKKKKTRIMKSN